MFDILYNVFSFLIVISIIVFVHEFGHYIVARISGVKVEIFSIGMGPKLFSWKDNKGTIWQISALMIGGYVKMFGDKNPASEADSQFLEKLNQEQKKISFHYKPLWIKSLIVSAGPIANILLAVLVLFILYGFYGKPIISTQVTNVEQNSVAQKAGILPGDIILEVNKKKTLDFKDLRRIIKTNPGKKLKIKISRNGEINEIEIKPEIRKEKDLYGKFLNVGFIGLYSDKIINQKFGFIELLYVSFSEVLEITYLTFSAIKNLFIGNLSSESLSGPIKIAKYSGQSFKNGFNSFLWFIALLSINLGVINLLPVPVLDGGHLFFYLLEAVRGRPLNDKIQELSFKIGIAIIGSLMIFSILSDVFSLFSQ